MEIAQAGLQALPAFSFEAKTSPPPFQTICDARTNNQIYHRQ
jgi:hypothetical protein